MIEIGATPSYTSISADDLLVCAGADTVIIACAEIQGGEFGFYWEFSTDNGAIWDSLETGIGGAHSALFTTSQMEKR